MTASDHRKAMKRTLESFAPRHRAWQAFDAWCEAAALAIANSVTPHQAPSWREREDRFERILDGFGPGAKEAFAEILAHLVEALALEPADQLGLLAADLEALDRGAGQFFTPYELSRLIADLTLSDGQLEATIRERGFVTVHEPAAGAGGMIIALAAAMRERGLNPQTQMHATCWDVESAAAHMCYVQLSLLNIPAVVVLGDTLILEAHQVLETPAHVLGLWRYRLQRADEGAAREPVTIPRLLGPLAEQPPLFQETA
ncbi:MAG TPA: N-6 DNA methylase [Trueperaceae bacterium]